MKSLRDLDTFSRKLPSGENIMPMLFIGHGSPMNAIEENQFSRGWTEIGKTLPHPQAVLCISAHWETSGTFVTAMEQPRTIHDFYGFPEELFEVHYPAPGSPALAHQTEEIVRKALIQLDEMWGLDHGCWSVLKHLYPSADVPVLQLSLDHTKPADWHFDLASDLAALRRRGVLIVGSGNMVHNLRLIDWQHPDKPYDWAEEMNTKIKTRILEGNTDLLVRYERLGESAHLAIPTPEHYLPLLYILASREPNERITIFNDKAILGSISMTSLHIS
ncbi:MAG TPA: 4,5-DOPA dioxygenase extradiol [Bacteroidota bacterium]|nr:4,5-DOPA dioxygenase extradiol [Bacteroidota bacterium]